MKKIDPKALAAVALSGLLVAGCENFATKDDIDKVTKVQAALEEAVEQRQEAEEKLTQVQAKLAEAVRDLQVMPQTTSDSYRYWKIEFEFDNLDTIRQGDKADPRATFMGELKGIFDGLEAIGFDVSGVSSKDGHVKYTVRRPNGFVTETEKTGIENAIAAAATDAKIEIPVRLDRDPKLVTLREAILTYNSVQVAAATERDSAVRCFVDIFVTPNRTSEISRGSICRSL